MLRPSWRGCWIRWRQLSPSRAGRRAQRPGILAHFARRCSTEGRQPSRRTRLAGGQTKSHRPRSGTEAGNQDASSRARPHREVANNRYECGHRRLKVACDRCRG